MGEQSEAAFAQATQGAQEDVAGAGVDVERPASAGCLTGVRMPMSAPS